MIPVGVTVDGKWRRRSRRADGSGRWHVGQEWRREAQGGASRSRQIELAPSSAAALERILVGRQRVRDRLGNLFKTQAKAARMDASRRVPDALRPCSTSRRRGENGAFCQRRRRLAEPGIPRSDVPLQQPEPGVVIFLRDMQGPVKAAQELDFAGDERFLRTTRRRGQLSRPPSVARYSVKRTSSSDDT